ncbi:flagellar hook-length control protein FliK [Buchnera aphidicola]|uniref:flagellar hook-length control protein FliK n=1 Tax=Buchnera aphidicola TaxID=9 RepID=UPI000D593077|nr:flagellar hook-length control protein FliK [Buchnera aphidicola]AWI49861.1 hypothetical protein DEO29_02615 [Buchnera aphidicola (Schizaphis graminum)]
MFKYSDNIALEGKLSDNQNNNLTSLNFFSKSNINAFKKLFINKGIEFDNVSTKKKKEEDKNITSINFVITNLINILNKKDTMLKETMLNHIAKKNYKCRNIQRKNKDKNFKLKKYIKLDIETKNETKKNQKYKKFIVHPIFKKSIEIKNQSNEFKQINIFHNFNDKFFFRKDRYSNIKSNKSIFSDNKILRCFRNFRKNTPDLFFLKNINKISNVTTYETNTFKDNNNKKHLKCVNSSLELLNSKKNDKWKQVINHQILLSISNKENKAEISFTPEYLGSIHIKIKMRNDQATLNFISNHDEVKVFLKNCIPFLKNSLMKNGIQLEKINIYNSSFSKNHISQKNKRIVKNYFFHGNEFKKTFNFQENYMKLIQYKSIDMYI